MDRARFRLVQELYFAVLDLPEAARADMLAARCGDDAALREEVESLLEIDALPAGPLDTAGAFKQFHALNDGTGAWLGRRLGPWELDGVLGRGGMGTVFSAKRVDAPFEQRVAVKVLTHRVFDREGHERFDRERRLLARLDHPLIARLIDGGVSDDGVPYLVMEYVDGVPIDVWCVRQRLSGRERLRLFQQVCAAVQHAHGRLILHRDIKPSNVLVNTDGHPRLLDFGVARALPGAHDDDTVTRPGMAPFTPEYAAPEQFAGAELSAATDVYQLGVMLYRLLTGVLPFRYAGSQFAPLMQEVMERVPRAPSEAVATLPDGTLAETTLGLPPTPTARRTLRDTLRGDLDEIVMMAIRKEPEQRYRTVTELSDDIDAYLEGRPVRAHGRSRGYRLRKFAGRHRTAVALASLVVLSVIAGGAATTRATWRAQAEAARAVHEAGKAGAINQFLQQMLASADPFRMGGDVTVRDALDRAAASIDTSFRAQPEIRAGIWSTIGQTYANLGAVPESRRYLDSAIAGYDRLGLRYSRDAFAAHAARLDGLFGDSRFHELREGVAAVRPGFTRAFGPQDSTVLLLASLDALAAFGTGAIDAAVDSLDAVLPRMRITFGAASPTVARTELALANLLALQARRTDEALALVRHGLEAVEPLGAMNATYLVVQGFAVEALARLGRPDEAEAIARAMVTRHETIWGAGSAFTLGPRRLLALSLLENRRADTALVIMRQVVADATALLAADSPGRVQLEQDLGTLLISFGEPAEAERLLRSAYAFHAGTDGESSPKAMLAYQNLAGAVRAQGRSEEALEMMQGVIERHASAGRHGNDLFFGVLHLADLLRSVRGPGEALALLDRHLSDARAHLPRGSRALNMLLAQRGQVLQSLGRMPEAEAALVEVRENYLAERNGDAAHPDVRFATATLVAFYESTGDRERAAALRGEGR